MICCVDIEYIVLSICNLRLLDIFAAQNLYVFAYTQTRYDTNPRSRSEHIEYFSTYRIENPARICIDAKSKILSIKIPLGFSRGVNFMVL